MSPFEYVIVLISIIIGLGITTILTGVAELIKHTRPVKLYAPHLIWIVIIFVLHIQEWWVSYGLKSIAVWHLHSFLLIVLYPINLYILAHLLFPGEHDENLNLKRFFDTNYPRIFVGAIVLVLISLLHNLLFLKLDPVTQLPHLLVGLALFTILMLRPKGQLVHLLTAAFLLAIMVIGFALDQQHLVIR